MKPGEQSKRRVSAWGACELGCWRQSARGAWLTCAFAWRLVSTAALSSCLYRRVRLNCPNASVTRTSAVSSNSRITHALHPSINLERFSWNRIFKNGGGSPLLVVTSWIFVDFSGKVDVYARMSSACAPYESLSVCTSYILLWRPRTYSNLVYALA